MKRLCVLVCCQIIPAFFPVEMVNLAMTCDILHGFHFIWALSRQELTTISCNTRIISFF